MKQVNLKKLNIEELRFSFWTSLTDNLLEKIRSVVAPDKDGDYMFEESYRIGNVRHSIVAMVSESGDKGRYRVGVLCNIRSGRGLRKGVGNVSELFGILSAIKEEMKVSCFLYLSFGRRKKYKKVISLPMKITDMPEALYDEVRGIHLAKREGKGLRYDVVVDVERDGNLTELINYRKMLSIKESILEDVIEEGLKISDGFVLREG